MSCFPTSHGEPRGPGHFSRLLSVRGFWVRETWPHSGFDCSMAVRLGACLFSTRSDGTDVAAHTGRLIGHVTDCATAASGHTALLKGKGSVGLPPAQVLAFGIWGFPRSHLPQQRTTQRGGGLRCMVMGMVVSASPPHASQPQGRKQLFSLYRWGCGSPERLRGC